MIPDYAGIAGHVNGFGGLTGSPGHTGWNNRGRVARNGILGYNTQNTFADILDGTSSTICVGEVSAFVYESNGTRRDRRPGYQHGFAMGCQGRNNSTDLSLPGNNDARVFNTVSLRYAINQTCKDGVCNLGNGNCNDGVCQNMGNNHPLASLHPGGVHVLFADGSVHFATDSTDVNLLARWADRNDGLAAESP